MKNDVMSASIFNDSDGPSRRRKTTESGAWIANGWFYENVEDIIDMKKKELRELHEKLIREAFLKQQTKNSANG